MYRLNLSHTITFLLFILFYFILMDCFLLLFCNFVAGHGIVVAGHTNGVTHG